MRRNFKDKWLASRLEGGRWLLLGMWGRRGERSRRAVRGDRAGGRRALGEVSAPPGVPLDDVRRLPLLRPRECVDLFVNAGQRELAAEGRECDAGFVPDVDGQEPLTGSLAPVVLEASLAGGDQHVLLERDDALVVGELR